MPTCPARPWNLGSPYPGRGIRRGRVPPGRRPGWRILLSSRTCLQAVSRPRSRSYAKSFPDAGKDLFPWNWRYLAGAQLSQTSARDLCPSPVDVSLWRVKAAQHRRRNPCPILHRQGDRLRDQFLCRHRLVPPVQLKTSGSTLSCHRVRVNGLPAGHVRPVKSAADPGGRTSTGADAPVSRYAQGRGPRPRLSGAGVDKR